MIYNFLQNKDQQVFNQMSFQQTPKGPLTHSAIRRYFFRQIPKSQFDKIFKKQTYIGSGQQGQVYKAQTSYGQIVAIKYFRKQYMGPQLINYIRSQIEALQQIKHQNILDLIQSYQIITNNNIKKFCIVTEFCQANLGNYQVIFEKQPTDLQKLKICQQIVSGIKAAHSKKIMHRDIKPDNILIKDSIQMKVKIADFGCSRMRSEDNVKGQNLGMTRCVGTPVYSDPKISDGNYTSKCDVYSAGLVIIYVFCGKQFFQKCTTREQLIVQKRKFTSDIEQSCRQFLQEYDDDQISPKLKQFLVQIACFTMEQDQDNRHNSAQLLEFISNTVKNFERQELYKTEIIVQQSSLKYPKQQVQNQNLFKKKPHSQNSNGLDSPDMKVNKQNNQIMINSKIQDLKATQLSFSSKNSKQTIQTVDRSIDQPKAIEQSLSHFKKNNKLDSNLDQQSSSALINNSLQQSTYQTPKRDSIKKHQNSFISSQSNQFDDYSSSKKSTIKHRRMFKNLKVNSSILQSQSPALRQKQYLSQSLLRQSRINQNQKKLDDKQKLCSQIIRHLIQSSHINDQYRSFKKLLQTFEQKKFYFQKINDICSLPQNYFAKGQRQCIVFLFFYLYAAKLKDIALCVQGDVAKSKMQQVKINSKRKQFIYGLVDAQIQRIKKNIFFYANDLSKKANLLKPKLSDVTLRCIKQVIFEKLLLNINFNEEQAEAETKHMIEDIQSKIKNQEDLQVMRELNKAVKRICN